MEKPKEVKGPEEEKEEEEILESKVLEEEGAKEEEEKKEKVEEVVEEEVTPTTGFSVEQLEMLIEVSDLLMEAVTSPDPSKALSKLAKYQSTKLKRKQRKPPRRRK